MDTDSPPSKTSAGSERNFVKSLGSLDIFFLGFGSMIGFGWIVMTGNWLLDAGSAGAIVAFLIGGAIMTLVGLVYSELVSAMPLAGGEHNYLLRGMGPKAAMLGSWGIIGGYVTVVLFESVAVPRTALYLFPDLNQVRLWTVAGSEVYLTWALLGTVTAAILTWINIKGIRLASLFQTSVMMFLVLVGVIMFAAALFGGEPGNMEPFFIGGGGGIVAVLVVVPFLFIGFDVIPQSAEEAKVPARQIGKLVVISVVMATLFYIIVVTATSLAVPASALAGMDLAAADAMSVMLDNDFWGQFVVAGGLAGIVTTWNAFLIGASRLLWAMANSGMLPHWFAKMHPKNGTPVNALLAIGVLSMVTPFFGEAMLVWAVDSGGPSIIFTYLMVSIVFLILRRREPQMDRPMRVGGSSPFVGTLVGALAVVTTAMMLLLYLPGMPAFLSLEPWIMFVAWWMVGIAFALKIPGGVKPGPNAEHDLLSKLASLGRGPKT